MTTKSIDVAQNHQQVVEFMKELQPIRQPIEILMGGTPIGRIVPSEELTQQEKERILQEGWNAVQEARERNKGVPEREIARAVDAAVERVRSAK
jgi:antitoxin (DNA-binding transcriptional repressor) of toxin-antitoxin stability system